MGSKKKLILGIITIVMITAITIFILTIVKDRKEKNSNMESIRNNYNLLTTSINNYNEIRSKYNEMSSVLLIDSYKEKHEEFVSLLEEYNKEMENIDTYITNIKLRCTGIYNDSEINKVCNSYKTVYEKLVNLYISDIDNYNDFITKYNENKNEELELIKKVHDSYIDFDDDGSKYGGVSNDESKS